MNLPTQVYSRFKPFVHHFQSSIISHYTPLFAAASNNHIDVVRLLTAHEKIRLNSKNSKGRLIHPHRLPFSLQQKRGSQTSSIICSLVMASILRPHTRMGCLQKTSHRQTITGTLFTSSTRTRISTTKLFGTPQGQCLKNCTAATRHHRSSGGSGEPLQHIRTPQLRLTLVFGPSTISNTNSGYSKRPCLSPTNQKSNLGDSPLSNVDLKK